jgi:hypothetical protein
MNGIEIYLWMLYYFNMRKNNEPMKALSLSIPCKLSEKIEKSAKQNRRSFTQEVVWRLEQSYASSNCDDSKFVTER